MNAFIAGWYLVYTKPRHEKKVYDRLTELHITSFLPTRKNIRQWHDRKKYVEEPIFPSYVFLFLNDIKNYYDKVDMDGVIGYVKIGRQIARVDETIVNSLKLATNHSEEIVVSDQYFQPRQRLVINKGVLTGLSCEAIQYNSKKKLLVRVDLLQRNVLLTLHEEYLMQGNLITVK